MQFSKVLTSPGSRASIAPGGESDGGGSKARKDCRAIGCGFSIRGAAPSYVELCPSCLVPNMPSNGGASSHLDRNSAASTTPSRRSNGFAYPCMPMNSPGVLEISVGPGGSPPTDFISFVDKVANRVQLAPKFSAILHDYKDVSSHVSSHHCTEIGIFLACPRPYLGFHRRTGNRLSSKRHCH